MLLVQNEYWQEAIENTEKIAEYIPSDSVMLFQQNFREGYTGWLYATPLTFIYDRNCQFINEYSDQFRMQISTWLEDGRDVVLLTPIDINFKALLLDFDIVFGGQFTIELTVPQGGTSAPQTWPFKINQTQTIYFIVPKNQTELINADYEDADKIWNYLYGWCDSEGQGGITTRWMEDEATLHIYSAENRTAEISFVAYSFYHPRTLDIYNGDNLQLRETVPSDFITISTQILLEKGSNFIRFQVAEGCERPCDIPELQSDDCRCLSLAIRNITIT